MRALCCQLEDDPIQVIMPRNVYIISIMRWTGLLPPWAEVLLNGHFVRAENILIVVPDK